MAMGIARIAVHPSNRTDVRLITLIVTSNDRYHGLPGSVTLTDVEECVTRLRVWLTKALEDQNTTATPEEG